LLNFSIAVLAVILMLYYNRFGKRTGLLGNAVVSTTMAVPFIFGGAIGGIDSILWLFAMLAFLSGMGREIVKGMADVVGDRERGVNTLAVSKGLDVAAKVGALFFVLAVLLSAAPLILKLVAWIYAPIILACDLGFLYTSNSILRDPSSNNAMKSKKLALVWMLLGLLGFLAGGLTVAQ
jgi:geranylgeranylglycerol-phosphate geranylgeranyltransferase